MRNLWQMWESSVPDTVIDSIVKLGEDTDPQDGTIFAKGAVDSNVRSSTVRWLYDRGVKSILNDYVVLANNNAFGVNLNGHCEMQFTEYHASEGGHYDWHHDVHWNGSTNSDRKLSITIQLSDPSEYEGGDFEFQECETPSCKAKGSVLVFPSYLKHRVTPVTSGTRRSLVAWFFGPRWR